MGALQPRDATSSSLYSSLNPSLQLQGNSLFPNNKSQSNTILMKNNFLDKQIQTNYKQQKQETKWYNQVCFTPQSKFIIIWKCATLVLIYLYFLEIPITIAFENHRNQEQSEYFFAIVNVPALLIFIIGVFIKLKTAFYKQGILISDRAKICRNYIVYSLLFDFLSIIAVIVYEFAEILRSHEKSPEPIKYRFIVLFFYLKIPELVSIQSSIIASFQLKRRVKAFFKLFLLLIKIFMLSNVVACGFFYISDNTCPIDTCAECCWINQLDILGKSLKQAQWTLQYAFSLYWASTTMLTIGYGDITPQNTPEVIYTVAAQFISCVLFAFSINEIWGIIQQKNSKKIKIHSRMNIMNVYMRDKNVGDQLKSRVNAYLSHFYHTKNLREKQLQAEIISELTPSLKKQLYYQSYGFIFNTNLLFRTFSQDFLEDLSRHIREVGFFQQQIVYSPETQQLISLYYIYKGQLVSFIDLQNPKVQDVILQKYKNDTLAGLYQFMRQINYKSSLMALKYSLLYVLDYQNWINTLEGYDQDREKYFMVRHSAQYCRALYQMKIQCKLCLSNKHESDMCLDSQIREKNSRFLEKYLEKAQRKKFQRRKLKANLNDFKSQHFVMQTPSKQRQQRKGSLVINSSSPFRKDSITKVKVFETNKRIFHKKVHKQKIKRILQMQKMKQSIWQQEDSSQGSILHESLMQMQSVQNYQTYCPHMNVTYNDQKQIWRQTFRRMQ